jgi:membrane protease YdiL (CAAX protease family)
MGAEQTSSLHRIDFQSTEEIHLPDAHQPETNEPQPPESAAPADQIAEAVLPSSPRFTLREIFFGSDGLRAGWSLLLYIVLLAALIAGGGYLINPHHKPAVTQTNSAAQPNTSAQPKPQSSQPPAPAPPALLSTKAVLLGEGTALLSVLIATWLMAKIERRPTAAYGLGGRHRLRNFLSGLVWGVSLLSLLVFTLRACGLLVFDARQLFGVSALRFGAVWLAGFLLVGLFEETFFRGYLQFTLARGINGVYGWLRSFGAQATECSATGLNNTGPCATIQNAPGFWTAALLLSFGFGFTHRTNAGESPIGLVAAALIAVVFCLSLWRTGSLWWAIGFHAAWDWAQSFLYGVADSGTLIQGHLFATHPAGRVLLSGGLTGPEGSLFILPIVGLTAAVIVLTLPRVHPNDPPASANTRTTTGLDLP